MVQRAKSRLLKALDVMQEANDELRQELLRHKRMTDKAVRQIASGEATLTGVRAGAVPEARGELTDAMERFERARREARLATFAYLGAVPRVTTSEIARTLGISRQLASRLAIEADGG